jgi:hypothetical protein
VVKVWKVILAALVIFAAGVVTGGLTVRLKVQEPAPAANAPGLGPLRQRGELLDRMQRQLYLSAAQREHIEKILRESHDRMKQIWDSIAPQAQEERRRVNDLIRAELQPEQKKRFEEMLKSRGPNRTMDERRRREEWREPRTPHRPEGGAPPASAPPENRTP